jgi:hypothetical protein
MDHLTESLRVTSVTAQDSHVATPLSLAWLSMKLLMPVMIAITLATFWLASIASVAAPQTCQVPGQYDTIQAAVDAACARIDLVADVYTETVTISAGAVHISGQGIEQTTVQMVGEYQSIFNISAGATVTLTGMTIRHGDGYDGGAVRNGGGAVWIEAVALEDNKGHRGGAIFNQNGTVSILNSIFRLNDGAFGGALHNLGGSVHISATQFSANRVTASSRHGGALYNEQGDLTVIASSFTGNSSDQSAGAIYNKAGAVTIARSSFDANTAPNGGGLVNLGGYLTVTGSTLSNHTNDGDGGAILNQSAGILAIADTHFTANTASRGAALDNRGFASVVSSTFTNNTGGYGAAAIENEWWSSGLPKANLEVFSSSFSANQGMVINNTSGGIATISTSTFFQNDAGNGVLVNWSSSMGESLLTLDRSSLVNNTAYFGAVHNNGTMTITNSTLSGNDGLQGAAIRNYHGTLTMGSSTVAHNSGQGAVIYQHGTLSMRNSILAANQPASCEDRMVTSLGYNLDEDGSCQLNDATDQRGIDPLLTPLHLYDGAHSYHALLPDSPAVDSTPAELCPPIDQRGAPRPADGIGDGHAACDVGAIERLPTWPLADFALSRRIATTGMPIYFTNLSSGDYHTSLWQFGDGATSPGPLPDHSYTQLGVYTVTLTIEGDNGTDRLARPSHIYIAENVYDIYLPQLLSTVP